MKKRLLAMILSALLVANISSCVAVPEDKIGEPFENTDTTESNFEEIDEKTTESEANTEPVDVESEYDPVTNMRYTLNADGKSYTVCPVGLPDVIKELVIPGEYKGLPVTEVRGEMGEHSIETIIISEGIKEISIGFYYCRDIKNIYIPASAIYITKGAFNCRATMGGHGFKKSNVIEKIVVAEGNPYYYVDENCLIEKNSQKIILGCNSSVIPNDGSVKSIGYAAFANCHAIESIILPKSITEIEYAAFDNCDNLKQVYITSSISEDKKIINFDEETAFGGGPKCIFYVPDTESLKIYSKVFGPYASFEVTEQTDTQKKLIDGQETIARTKSYHYYKVVGTFELGCEIYNAAGDIVFNEKTLRPLTVSEITSDLIEVRIGYGSGISGCRYFSVEKNQMSEEFFYVVATSGTQIAYLNGSINDRKLIVQDIYQHTIDCQSFDLNFSPEHTPVVDAEFADDGAILQITYMKGESRETTKTTLELT